MKARKLTSKSITDEHSNAFISMRIHVRYARVPVEWHRVQPRWPYVAPDWPITFGEWEPTMAGNSSWFWTLIPSAVGHEASTTSLDPFALRTEFFKLDVSDLDAVLEFLSRVGIWDLQPGADPHQPTAHVSEVMAGFRRLNGLSLATSPAELRAAQVHWTSRLDALGKNPRSVHDEFGLPTSFGGVLRAENFNNLPLHIEWKRNSPQGVISPVTLNELLRTTFHVDMLTGAQPQICERHDCGVRFTGRKRQYCSDECARVIATRAWRQRKREQQYLRQRKGNRWNRSRNYSGN